MTTKATGLRLLEFLEASEAYVETPHRPPTEGDLIITIRRVQPDDVVVLRGLTRTFEISAWHAQSEPLSLFVIAHRGPGRELRLSLLLTRPIEGQPSSPGRVLAQSDYVPHRLVSSGGLSYANLAEFAKSHSLIWERLLMALWAVNNHLEEIGL